MRSKAPNSILPTRPATETLTSLRKLLSTSAGSEIHEHFYGPASSSKSLCQWLCKNVSFPSMVAKMAFTFLLDLVWKLESAPHCILFPSSCTPHEYFWNPTFVSNSFSNCVFHTLSLNSCVSILWYVPLTYTEDTASVVPVSVTQTFLGLSGRQLSWGSRLATFEGLPHCTVQCLASAP